MSKLMRENYLGDTVSIAAGLLGRYLVRMWQGQPLVCRIVETEAYVGAVDKAAHAYGYHKTRATPSCLARRAMRISTSFMGCTAA